jgi:hypothetical protein
LALWSGLELDVALICACMPSVYPLLLRLIQLGRRKAQKVEPGPGSSFVTIGGSGGKHSKNHGPWSISDTTRLTATNPHEDRNSERDFVELSETSTRPAHN